MRIPNWVIYGFYTALIVSTFFYVRSVEFDSIASQNKVYAQLDSNTIQKVSIGTSSKPLYIASWQPFIDSGEWGYVSNTSLLKPGFTPKNLVKVPVTHSEPTNMRINTVISQPLKNLFNKAETEGYNLIVASAYRSIEDQQTLVDEFVAARGEAAAREFVATPRGSEHHTGLAVDIDDNSPQCKIDSFTCSLSPDSAAWLASNAPEFGFIIRYPEGKKSITGIAAEQWHFRYVGVPLAQKLTESGLTFDEFISQVAPGRIDSK